jgi:hypothetical protein
VFSGEQGAHVCSHLVSSKQGWIPEGGGGCWKDGGTPTCNAVHHAMHSGRGTRDTLCVIWELWA